MDTYNRTFAKTLTYRTITFVLSFVITYLLTNQYSTSTLVAALSVTLGALTFFVHERVWTKVKWGMLGSIDFKIRSFVKTVTYRLWSLFAVFVIGLILGLESNDALTLTFTLNIMYMLSHYVNERVWNKVKWGKI